MTSLAATRGDVHDWVYRVNCLKSDLEQLTGSQETEGSFLCEEAKLHKGHTYGLPSSASAEERATWRETHFPAMTEKVKILMQNALDLQNTLRKVTDQKPTDSHVYSRIDKELLETVEFIHPALATEIKTEDAEAAFRITEAEAYLEHAQHTAAKIEEMQKKLCDRYNWWAYSIQHKNCVMMSEVEWQARCNASSLSFGWFDKAPYATTALEEALIKDREREYPRDPSPPARAEPAHTPITKDSTFSATMKAMDTAREKMKRTNGDATVASLILESYPKYREQANALCEQLSKAENNAAKLGGIHAQLITLQGQILRSSSMGGWIKQIRENRPTYNTLFGSLGKNYRISDADRARLAYLSSELLDKVSTSCAKAATTTAEIARDVAFIEQVDIEGYDTLYEQVKKLMFQVNTSLAPHREGRATTSKSPSSE